MQRSSTVPANMWLLSEEHKREEGIFSIDSDESEEATPRASSALPQPTNNSGTALSAMPALVPTNGSTQIMHAVLGVQPTNEVDASAVGSFISYVQTMFSRHDDDDKKQQSKAAQLSHHQSRKSPTISSDTKHQPIRTVGFEVIAPDQQAPSPVCDDKPEASARLHSSAYSSGVQMEDGRSLEVVTEASTNKSRAKNTLMKNASQKRVEGFTVNNNKAMLFDKDTSTRENSEQVQARVAMINS